MKQTRRWGLLFLICTQFVATMPNFVAADTPEIPLTSDQLIEGSEETEQRDDTQYWQQVKKKQKNNSFETAQQPKEEVEADDFNTQASKSNKADLPQEKGSPEKQQETKNNYKAYEETIENPTEESFKRPPNEITWKFIEDIGEDAHEIAQKEDLFASVMIAQAILESNSGQSQLSQAPYFNIFGIKGTYKGKGVSFKTQENSADGNFFTKNATFRHYENYTDSLDDYAKLLKEGLTQEPTFYKGAWKTEADDYKEATEFLTGHYATDIHYNKKLNALIEVYDLTSFDENTDESYETGSYISPVKSAVVTSTYGDRNGRLHRGIDLAAEQGTAVKAAKQGKVTYAGYHPSWGNYVTILHSDGLTTLYAHCDKNLVKAGQTVKQGQNIALLGSTGNSTGPHLHFEVNRSQSLNQEQLIDPSTVLNM